MVTLQQRACTPQALHYQRTKDSLDFLLALVMLIALMPLQLAIAILILLDSTGSSFFRQQRVGMHGRLFTIYKFRTMKVGAPCLSTEEMQRLGADPSTRIGKILRKTSLDELPQLLNILKGEMSFIGPRPALPSQSVVNNRRFQLGADGVKPGITGLAQVMGRDELDDETKVQYDADYCANQSLLLDAKIMLLTFKVVLTAHGNL